jgi:hypothetical protein
MRTIMDQESGLHWKMVGICGCVATVTQGSVSRGLSQGSRRGLNPALALRSALFVAGFANTMAGVELRESEGEIE